MLYTYLLRAPNHLQLVSSQITTKANSRISKHALDLKGIKLGVHTPTQTVPRSFLQGSRAKTSPMGQSTQIVGQIESPAPPTPKIECLNFNKESCCYETIGKNQPNITKALFESVTKTSRRCNHLTKRPLPLQPTTRRGLTTRPAIL